MQRLAVALASNRYFWWFWVTVWAVALFILSSKSNPPNPVPPFPHQDKLLHFLYFTGGSTCFTIALWGSRTGNKLLRALPLIIAGTTFAAVIGALDEFHQSYTPGRFGNDIYDWCADVSGGLFGAWLALTFLRWVGRPQTRIQH